jgi:hypothetical protein
MDIESNVKFWISQSKKHKAKYLCYIMLYEEEKLTDIRVIDIFQYFDDYKYWFKKLGYKLKFSHDGTGVSWTLINKKAKNKEIKFLLRKDLI